MLEVKNISFKYGDRVIFDNINLTFKFKTINLVFGESSVGKTTLLSIMTGNLQPLSGQILYNGKPIDSRYKRTVISYIDQDGQAFDNMKIIDHFKFIANIVSIPFDLDNVKACLNKVGLDESFLKLYPKKISGGERKRFLIALALFKQSKIIFLDEPTAALDDTNTKTLQAIMYDLAREGKMIIATTHDKRLIDKDMNIYEIMNNQTIAHLNSANVDEDDSDDKPPDVNSVISFKYLDYKNKIQKILILILLMLGSGLFHLSSTTLLINYRISKNTDKNLEQSMISQIHLRKTYFDTSIIDGFRDYAHSTPTRGDNMPLTKDELTEIENIEGIKEIYTYPVLATEYYEDELNPDDLDQAVTSINLDGSDYPVDEYSIETVPFYSFNHEVVPNKNYISQELANILGITEINEPVKLIVDLGIPVAQFIENSECTFSRWDSETNSTYVYLTADVDSCRIIYEKHSVELEIAGIVENDNSFDYFMTSQYYIALDYNNINAIIDQYNGLNLNYYQDKYGKNVTEYSCNEYLIDVVDLDDLLSVENALKEMNNLFDTKAQYTNILEIAAITEINRRENVVNNAILIITIAGLFSFVIYHYFRSRNKEITLLSRFGLLDREIVRCFDVEMLLMIVLWLLIGVIINSYRLTDLAFYLEFTMPDRIQIVLVLSLIQLVMTLIIFTIYHFFITRFIKRYLL